MEKLLQMCQNVSTGELGISWRALHQHASTNDNKSLHILYLLSPSHSEQWNIWNRGLFKNSAAVWLVYILSHMQTYFGVADENIASRGEIADNKVIFILLYSDFPFVLPWSYLCCRLVRYMKRFNPFPHTTILQQTTFWKIYY